MQSVAGRLFLGLLLIAFMALGTVGVIQAQDPAQPPPYTPQNAPGSSAQPGKPFHPASAPAAPVTPQIEGQEVPIGYAISPAEMKALKEGIGSGQVPLSPGTARDTSVDQGVPQPSAPTSDSTWEAIPYTGWFPPDSQIAAGPSDLLAAVNSSFRGYDKSGGQLYSVTLLSWFTNVLPANTTNISVFDPWLLYDQVNGRYVMLAVASRSSDGLSQFLLSISNGSTASGSWCNYSFNARLDGSTDTNNWADYPKAGINGNSVILTANMFDLTSGYFQYSKVRFLPKSTLYDTSCPAVGWWDYWGQQNGDGSSAFTLQPAHSYVNSNSTYLVNAQFGSASYLTLWSTTTPDGPYSGASYPSLARQATLSVSSYSVPPDAEQPGTSTLIDTGDDRLLKSYHRDSGLWAAQTTGCIPSGDSVTRSCVRWYQINPATNTIVQQETFGASGYYYFYPAILPDAAQNAVMVFNRSSTSEYAGIRYTGRQSTDPANTLQTSAQLRAGQGCYNRSASGRNRWGDYSGIALDPASGKTWVLGEFAYGTSATCTSNSWRTQAGLLSWPSSALMSTTSPVTGTTVTAPFDVAGWAIDLSASSGTGVSAVGIYAIPQPSGSAISLGLATYGEAHPEVASTYGPQFLNSGFRLTVGAGVLAPGSYILRSYAYSTVAGAWNNSSDVTVTIPGTSTPTATPTATRTATPTDTSTPTPTFTPTASSTPTPTGTATRTPLPGEAATIFGHVALEGRSASPPDPSYAITGTLSLLLPGGGTAYSTTVTTDYSAYFTATNILTGTYDLRFKGSHTLSRRLTSVLLASGDNTIDFAGRGVLQEGDANNDNSVTILDFSLLRSAFSKCAGDAGSDPRTDFNQDGCTTILDFSLLRNNFGQVGE